MISQTSRYKVASRLVAGSSSGRSRGRDPCRSLELGMRIPLLELLPREQRRCEAYEAPRGAASSKTQCFAWRRQAVFAEGVRHVRRQAVPAGTLGGAGAQGGVCEDGDRERLRYVAMGTAHPRRDHAGASGDVPIRRKAGRPPLLGQLRPRPASRSSMRLGGRASLASEPSARDV